MEKPKKNELTIPNFFEQGGAVNIPQKNFLIIQTLATTPLPSVETQFPFSNTARYLCVPGFEAYVSLSLSPRRFLSLIQSKIEKRKNKRQNHASPSLCFFFAIPLPCHAHLQSEAKLSLIETVQPIEPNLISPFSGFTDQIFRTKLLRPSRARMASFVSAFFSQLLPLYSTL